MCTGFIKKGDDLLFGFNLDIDPEVWDYTLYKTKNYFTVGIKIGSTVYFTHGVNRNGNFSNLPYMNGVDTEKITGKNRERIDLMTDRYIRGKYSFADISDILRNKSIVNIPGNSLHSLIGDADGHMLLVEPGYGFKEYEGNYAVVTNFPVLAELSDYSNPFYGKDRYDAAVNALSAAGSNFSALDGINLLCKVSQTGQWGTRISFVYSQNENAVYYSLDGDFDHISKHYFIKDLGKQK